MEAQKKDKKVQDKTGSEIQKKDKSVQKKAKREIIVEVVMEKYLCPKCNKTFSSTSNLNKHAFLHKKRSLKYKKCSYKIASPYHLMEYKKKCVDGVKFNCMDCDQIFDHRMQLYRHVLKTY